MKAFFDERCRDEDNNEENQNMMCMTRMISNSSSSNYMSLDKLNLSKCLDAFNFQTGHDKNITAIISTMGPIVNDYIEKFIYVKDKHRHVEYLIGNVAVIVLFTNAPDLDFCFFMNGLIMSEVMDISLLNIEAPSSDDDLCEGFKGLNLKNIKEVLNIYVKVDGKTVISLSNVVEYFNLNVKSPTDKMKKLSDLMVTKSFKSYVNLIAKQSHIDAGAVIDSTGSGRYKKYHTSYPEALIFLTMWLSKSFQWDCINALVKRKETASGESIIQLITDKWDELAANVTRKPKFDA